MRIVVTGGSGKAGRWVVRDLRDRGHDVLNVDVAHDGSTHGLCVLADLTDIGQCHEVVAGADAVVHLAAIPAPEIRPAGETFRNNAMSTYNVFAASVERGVGRVVWASRDRKSVVEGNGGGDGPGDGGQHERDKQRGD